MWAVLYKQFYIRQSCWGLWGYASKHRNILPSVLQTSPGICQQPSLETKYEMRWICWLISSASLKPAAHNGNIKGLNKSYFNKMKTLLQPAVAPAFLLLPTALLSQGFWKLLTGFTTRPVRAGLSHQWRWQYSVRCRWPQFNHFCWIENSTTACGLMSERSQCTSGNGQ